MKAIFFLCLLGTFGVWGRSINIETAGGTLTFEATEASTPTERAKGLKYVTNLPEFQGMVFWFAPPSYPVFWMQDTLISLDMIFFDKGGNIVQIEPNCTPLSEKQIPAKHPVIGVLEIGGGLTQKHHIRVGDKLTF